MNLRIIGCHRVYAFHTMDGAAWLEHDHFATFAGVQICAVKAGYGSVAELMAMTTLAA